MAEKTLKEIKQIVRQIVLDRYDGEKDQEGNPIALRYVSILSLEKKRHTDCEFWDVLIGTRYYMAGYEIRLRIQLDLEGKLLSLREGTDEEEVDSYYGGEFSPKG